MVAPWSRSIVFVVAERVPEPVKNNDLLRPVKLLLTVPRLIAFQKLAVWPPEKSSSKPSVGGLIGAGGGVGGLGGCPLDASAKGSASPAQLAVTMSPSLTPPIKSRPATCGAAIDVPLKFASCPPL